MKLVDYEEIKGLPVGVAGFADEKREAVESLFLCSYVYTVKSFHFKIN